MKLCKDCQHFRPEEKFKDESKRLEYAKCANARASDIDFITGAQTQKYCAAMRILTCGKQAKYFEPKDGQ